MKGQAHFIHQAFTLAVLLIGLAGCQLPFGDPHAAPQADIAEAVTDVDGLARISGSAGVIDFQAVSGLTGERVAGVQLEVASVGSSRFIYASDPTGLYLPVAAPLPGDQSVRRVVMPPAVPSGYNITTAEGAFNLNDLALIGTLSEADLRARLRQGGDQAALLYLYDPAQPLALTGAALDVYALPFDNTYLLKPGADVAGSGLVLVALNRDAYADWSHLAVDRYLASRIGQRPYTDLRADLTFGWAFPVFDVFPADEALELGAGDTVTLRINWRSQNPDPPPPWRFFVTADSEAVTIEPDNFALAPGQPPVEVTLTVDRVGLAEGTQAVTIFIQPFSDTFGLIEQGVERTLNFSVAEALPTPTAGPGLTLSLDPDEPHSGGTLTVTASGFAPGETVLLEFIGAERTISDGLAAADADGVYVYEIDLRNTPEGDYTLRLTGAESGLTATTEVTLGPEPPDAIVATDELNVRTGPSYDYPVIEILKRGDPLEVVGVNADDSWIEVITQTGVQGWVVTELVELFIDLADVPWNPNVPPPP